MLLTFLHPARFFIKLCLRLSHCSIKLTIKLKLCTLFYGTDKKNNNFCILILANLLIIKLIQLKFISLEINKIVALFRFISIFQPKNLLFHSMHLNFINLENPFYFYSIFYILANSK